MELGASHHGVSVLPLVLDDPYIGWDKEGDADVRKVLLSLKEKGKTILFASHSTENDKFVVRYDCRDRQGVLGISNSGFIT